MQTLVTLNVSKTMNITVARAQFNAYLITKYTQTTKKAVRLCKIADLPHLKFRMHQLDAVQNTNFTIKLISPISPTNRH